MSPRRATITTNEHSHYLKSKPRWLAPPLAISSFDGLFDGLGRLLKEFAHGGDPLWSVGGVQGLDPPRPDDVTILVSTTRFGAVMWSTISASRCTAAEPGRASFRAAGGRRIGLERLDLTPPRVRCRDGPAITSPQVRSRRAGSVTGIEVARQVWLFRLGDRSLR